MLTSEIIIIIIMLMFNSIFAAYEMSLASLSMGQIKIMIEQKKRGAKAALSMKSRMEASLAVVQIGITLAGAIAAATGGVGAEEAIAPILKDLFNLPDSFIKVLSIGLIVIPLTSITIVFGELVPKTLAIKNSGSICLFLSPLMKYFSYIAYPMVVFFEWATKKLVKIFERRINGGSTEHGEMGLIELRAQVSALRTSRIIDSEQEKIMIRTSNLAKIHVADIIIPAEEIVTLYADSDLTDHFVTIHLDPYTRFPVVERKSDPQSIIGYVNIKELIFLAKTHPENPNVREILRPMISFNANEKIGNAFSIMMKEHIHLALVRQDDNQILGMITIEDILEEVVGDIQDELDRLPKHITSIGKQYIVGGGVLMPALMNRFDMNESELGSTSEMTFNSWVKKNYQDTLRGGDLIRIDKFNILIRKIRHNQIHEAIISMQQISI